MPWMFLFYFAISMAASYAIGQLLMKKPKTTTPSKGKFDFPNVEEGRIYPVIFGTPRRVEDATIAWWGDVKTKAIEKKVSDGGWFSSAKYATVGYKYYVGVLMELCHGPIDGIKQMFIGGTLVWPNPDDPDELAADGVIAATIDVPKLFGGADSGGGVTGDADFLYGSDSQALNDYLQEHLSDTFEGKLQGAHSEGATTLTIDGLTPAEVFHPDDTLYIKGDEQLYTITTLATVNGSGVLVVLITPGLTGNKADNKDVTLRQDTAVSAGRGLVSVVLKQVYFGTSPYFQNFSFLCKRTNILDDGSTQWYLSKAVINDLDLNPAHIIRECLTNTRWGMGFSTGLCDDAIWQDVADQLYDESFGLSAIWDGQKDLADFIQDVLTNINGLLFQDLQTGQFILKLIRDDYIPGDLVTYDTEDIISVEDFSRPSLGEVADTVIIDYWDRKNNKVAIMPDHDIALMDAQGGRSVVYEASFPYIMDKTQASKIAAREARQISSMVATMKITAKRTMAHLKPGDTFKLEWSFLGIAELIVRILKANYGTLQNGEVVFECMEDVCSEEVAIYVPPPETSWEDPISEPLVSPARLLIETPFYTLAKNMGLPNALEIPLTAAYLGVNALRPSGDAFEYELLVRDSPTAEFVSEGSGPWIPSGITLAAIPKNAVDVTIELDAPLDLDMILVGTYAQIDDELFKVLAVNAADNEVTLARGVLDTVPELHSDGTRIWFLESYMFVVQREYDSASTPAAKVLPRTGRGDLDAAEVAIDSAPAFDGRQARPYPPGNFKVNNVSYPSTFSGQPTLSWAHRDRQQQMSSIVEHSAASIGPESSTTYEIEIYDEDNTLVRTEVGLTGTSYTYSEANERSDCGLSPTDPLNTQLRFVLYSKRSQIVSWQSYDLTVSRV